MRSRLLIVPVLGSCLFLAVGCASGTSNSKDEGSPPSVTESSTRKQGDDSKDSGSASKGNSKVSPIDAILGTGDLPEEYRVTNATENFLGWSDNNEQMESMEASIKFETKPSQCKAFGLMLEDIAEMAKDETSALQVAEVTTPDELSVAVLLTRGDGLKTPDDVDECSEFTSTVSVAQESFSVGYQVAPVDITITGADEVKAFEVTSSGAERSVMDSSGLMVFGETDGLTFQVTTEGTDHLELVQTVVQAQVDKITQMDK